MRDENSMLWPRVETKLAETLNSFQLQQKSMLKHDRMLYQVNKSASMQNSIISLLSFLKGVEL
jgi:hypothetical protein